MPRPQSKVDLLSEGQREYDALEKFLATLNVETMLAPGALGGWSGKDVLAHLLEWQRMFFVWYDAGLAGQTPAVPAPGYNWGQLPALNQTIYENYRDRPLDEVLGDFRQEHRKTIELIESLPDEDLFTRGRYAWMRNNHLAAYLTANTASHYRWARSEMKKHLNAKK